MSDSTIVYDDDCGFCTWWAERIAERAAVELVGFSEMNDDLRARLPEDYEQCAHLLADGEVYSCGEAIEEAVLRSERGEDLRPLANFARQFDEYSKFREKAYRAVADRRDFFGQFVSETPPARSDDE